MTHLLNTCGVWLRKDRNWAGGTEIIQYLCGHGVSAFVYTSGCVFCLQMRRFADSGSGPKDHMNTRLPRCVRGCRPCKAQMELRPFLLEKRLFSPFLFSG